MKGPGKFPVIRWPSFCKDRVITFQNRCINDFVRERIRNKSGKSKFGADYLMYSLIDTLVDGYLHTIENLGAAG